MSTTTPIQNSAPTGSAAPIAPAAPGAPAASPAPTRAVSRGLSIASIVLAAVALIADPTILVAVAGLVFGIVALQREPASRTLAIWGIVLNSVLLAGAAAFGVVGLVLGLQVVPFLFG